MLRKCYGKTVKLDYTLLHISRVPLFDVYASLAEFILEDGFPSKMGNSCDGFPSDMNMKRKPSDG